MQQKMSHTSCWPVHILILPFVVAAVAGDRTTRAAQIRRTHAAGSAIGVGIMSSTILLQSLHN